jgi:hypothetical protein
MQLLALHRVDGQEQKPYPERRLLLQTKRQPRRWPARVRAGAPRSQRL